jgi:hypothetical protein
MKLRRKGAASMEEGMKLLLVMGYKETTATNGRWLYIGYSSITRALPSSISAS